MSFSEPVSEAAAPNLISLLYGLPHHADDVVIASDSGQPRARPVLGHLFD